MKTWAFLIAAVLLPCAARASTPPPEDTYYLYPASTTTVQTLDNGLTVILTEDAAQTMGHVLLWVRAGSADAKSGQGDVARLTGLTLAQPVDPGEPSFADQARLFIADSGSWTGPTQSAYYAQLLPSSLPLFISIDSRRFQRIRFDPKTLDALKAGLAAALSKEAESSPESALAEALAETAAADSAPRGVTPDSAPGAASITAQDCADFYAAYYRPDNCALILDGPWSREDALKWVQNDFGTWLDSVPETGDERPPVFKPGLAAPVATTTAADLMLVELRLTEPGPRPGSAEDLLLNILFQARDSGLARARLLGPDGPAHALSFLPRDGDPGLAKILLSLAPGADPAKTLASFTDLAQDVADLSPAVFEDYRRAWLVQRRDELLDPRILNQNLGQAWSMDDLDRLDSGMQGQALPDLDEVATLARKLLVDSNLAGISCTVAP